MAAITPIERGSFSDPWSSRDFEDCVGRGIPFLVAEADSGVIGYVIAHHAVDEGEILNVGVSPTRRREGVGRALVEAVIRLLRERGVSAVFLEVRDSNGPAQGLYRSLGFREVGRRRHYYRRPAEDAVVLRTAI